MCESSSGQATVRTEKRTQQYPAHALAESVGEQDQHFYAGSGYSSFDLRKLPLPDVQTGCYCGVPSLAMPIF
jgi:hypothetical protein